MDRFRKCVEIVRSKWRKFVQRNWHNQSESGYFCRFGVIFLIGAIRPCNLTTKWQKACWKTYCLVAPFQFLFFALNFIEHLSNESTFRDKVWHTSLFASACICFVLQAIVNRYANAIQTAQDFINGKPCNSGDAFHDAAVRKKYFQRIQLTMSALILLLCLDQVVLLYPNSGIEKLLTTPRSLRPLGPKAANGIQFMVTATVAPLWLCKRLAGTILMCSLLSAFKMEWNVFLRGFDNILYRVEEDVEENLPKSTIATEDQPEALRRAQRDELFWKLLKKRVSDNIKKHIELVENLQSLQPVIKWIFGTIYYYTLALVSPFIFSTLLEGISLVAVIEVSTIGFFLLECFLWCNQIESLQDINDDLEVSIMDLMASIPCSEEHRNDYIGMQKTLMIMKVNVRNSARFCCAGVFDITIEEFRNLLDVSYSVLTFLIDMGKV